MALRKSMVAAAMVALAICGCTLAGCEAAKAEAGVERFVVTESVKLGAYSLAHVMTDMETGCQYIIWSDYEKGGMELLVDKYGYPLLADGYSRVEVGISEDEGE